MDEKQFVLVVGNPFDGLSLVGPFEDAEEANEYAEYAPEARDVDWWVVGMDAPSEEEEGEESL